MVKEGKASGPQDIVLLIQKACLHWETCSVEKAQKTDEDGAHIHKLLLAQVVNHDLGLEDVQIDAGKPDTMCYDRHIYCTHYLLVLLSGSQGTSVYACVNVCVLKES